MNLKVILMRKVMKSIDQAIRMKSYIRMKEYSLTRDMIKMKSRKGEGTRIKQKIRLIETLLMTEKLNKESRLDRLL